MSRPSTRAARAMQAIAEAGLCVEHHPNCFLRGDVVRAVNALRNQLELLHHPHERIAFTLKTNE